MWHNISISDVCKKLYVDLTNGLSSEEAARRQQTYGLNTLTEQKKPSLLKRFAEQICDYMVIILLIAAAISFAMGVIEGSLDFVDPIIILLIVILNASIGVFQESKAEKSLEALKKLASPTIRVKRDENIVILNAGELVPGDIIFLQSGDYVPADARLTDSISLRVDESALTGESVNVEKNHSLILDKDIPIGDTRNMVWSSTIVTHGRGTAIVTETGMNTQIGKIANLIITGETPQTPLQQKLAKTGQTLGTAALIICAVIFLMGVLRHIPPFDMFMTSVSLAVAAIPEGLPAIVTIMLSLGVQKMVKKNAIIRKLPAVETLGSATVICSDKTGTLTQNKMTVVDVFGKMDFVLELCCLCNNKSDPTETALADAAEKASLNKAELDSQYKRISELPFDSSRKLMTTVHKMNNCYRIITKGAPDILLERCNLPLEKKNLILSQNKKMAESALRVIAVAYSDVLTLPRELEYNLTFAGLVGMIDPPRPDVKEAVKTCKHAGIKAVMITGDHIETAIAIAKEIGIYTGTSKAITGMELSRLSDEELTAHINEYSVFARVTPEHKVRIVKAFQQKGAVVAMTGDGVNDAPALKAADIGCAMGISGTDVAKGAADMVLTDDNFATIVSAVREGRGIYSNIRKAVHFLLSSNIGEIVTIFAAILMGWQAPLIAIQLLWVNLVTDSLPAIALGVEAPDKYIMNNRPIDRKKGLFADNLGYVIFIEGVLIGSIALLAYSIGSNIFASLVVGRTMAFATLSLSQLVHAFNMRSERSLFKVGFFGNIYLVYAFIICAFMQISVISIPPLAIIFKVVPLSLSQWLMVAVLSLLPIITMELEKWIDRRKSGRTSLTPVEISNI